MANLRQPKSESDIKAMPIAKVREEYNKLASDYTKFVDGKILYCHKCGEFKVDDAFYKSHLNGSGKFHYCKQCVMELATDYDKKENKYTDNKEKTIEVCKMMDIPFIESLYNSCLSSINAEVKERNRETAWKQMVTVLHSLPQYVGKRWVDSEFNEFSEDPTVITRQPRKEIIKIFGSGFTNEDYLYLQDQYDDWRSRTQVDSKSQETYVVQICFAQLNLWKAQRSGKDTKELVKALDQLMNGANLQPKQNVSNAATDSLTFGQLIEKWEMEEPIPEPDPEFKDVDGIGHYLRVWFSGHLSKALGLKTVYSQEYEDEIAKYTVTKPEIQEEGSSDEIYDTLFGRDGE